MEILRKLTFGDIRPLRIAILHCFVPASKQRKIVSFKSGGRCSLDVFNSLALFPSSFDDDFNLPLVVS